MCIIALRPKGKVISDETIAECFRSHPHGAGFAYVDEEKNRLIIKKGFFNLEGLAAAIKEQGDRELLIHFRTASKGMAVNEASTHPFSVCSNVDQETKIPKYEFAVAHNGTLNWRSTNKHSDTSCFVDDLLDPILNRDPWFFDNDATSIIMERAIGIRNKMVVMKYDTEKNKTTVAILNEKEGNWEKGVWYSNYSWRPLPPVYNYHNDFSEWTPNAFVGKKTLVDGKEILWTEADHNGWAWSFVFDIWHNKKTSNKTSALSYRDRPYPGQFHNCKENTQQQNWDWVNRQPDKTERQLRLEAGSDLSDKEPDLSVPSIGHLNKDDLKILGAAAYKLFRDVMSMGKSEIRRYTTAEKLDWLRDWIKGEFEETEDMPYEVLDLWIIAGLKSGTVKIEPKVNVVVTEKDQDMAAANKMTEEWGGL
jgi:predicted glutamine amidotransferase